jgi:hypothetical protein
LYPHVGAAVLNIATVATLLVTPHRFGFDTATTIAMCACALLGVSQYAIAVTRIWRRLYRRHHYRMRVALPVSVAFDGDPATSAQTEDVSFGGASLAVSRSAATGAGVTVTISDPEPIRINGTVMSCAPAHAGFYRIGVRFERLDLQHEKRLLFLLLDHALGGRPTGDRRTDTLPSPHATPAAVAA